MKKKNPELDFSPQANMLHLLKSAKSMALSSPKRNTVLLQPSLLDVMGGKGAITVLHTVQQTVYTLNNIYNKTHGFYQGMEISYIFLNRLNMLTINYQLIINN